MSNPRFPIYIVSKSRHETRLTSKALESMRVPYFIVVEEQEADAYRAVIEKSKVLVLDKKYQRDYDAFDTLGDAKSKGPGAARNFAWDHAISRGAEWHWVMDDNIRHFYRLHQNLKVPVADGTMFQCMEDFVLRYANVAMAGPNYYMFAPRKTKVPPFIVNTRIYSCNLIRNYVGFRWRGRYNEDTDLSLRMLKAGWCTVQFNAFLQQKMPTQKIKGGNTKDFYAKEGTLPKSRMLVSMHPDVSKLTWKFNRWHHEVDYRPFKHNKLILKADAKVKRGADNYGMKLVTLEDYKPRALPFSRSNEKAAQIVVPKNSDILAEISKPALQAYLENCAKYVDLDVRRAYAVTLACMKDHDGQPVTDEELGEWKELKTRWYKSLANGGPDYGVYASPFYFCEIWLCWVKYSRKYLRTMLSGTSMTTKSIAVDVEDSRTILDLGCGFGYTTAALKQMFPQAQVTGTNLEGTSQFKMAADLGKRHGFAMASDHARPADLVFASEYFEHIDRPLEHLIDVLKKCEPKYLLIANSFDTEAIGHFPRYLHGSAAYPASQMGRMFGAVMRSHGYQKVETKCWNNRPAYWKRSA